MSMYSEWSLHFRFPDQNFLRISHLSQILATRIRTELCNMRVKFTTVNIANLWNRVQNVVCIFN
jgi:hypothetical protein